MCFKGVNKSNLQFMVIFGVLRYNAWKLLNLRSICPFFCTLRINLVIAKRIFINFEIG